MKKTSKELLFERMHTVGGMPLEESVDVEFIRKKVKDSNKLSINTLDNIIDITKGKGSHAMWLTKKVADGLIDENDIFLWNDYLDIYKRYKNKFKHNDINSFKTNNDINDFIETVNGIKEKEKTNPSSQKGIEKSKKYQDYKIGTVEEFDVYEIPQGRIDLYGMSCDLGSGTGWCTATGKDRKQFDKYVKEGNLYIITNGNEKYEFHYPSDEYMDKNNKSLFLLDMKDFDKYYSIFEFLEDKRGEEIPDAMYFVKNPSYELAKRMYGGKVLREIININPNLIKYLEDRLKNLDHTDIVRIINKHPKLIKYFKNNKDKLNKNTIEFFNRKYLKN